MIIALTGQAGAGKSEGFNIFKENSDGKPVTLLKFAAPLYKIQEYAYTLISSVYTRPENFVKDRKFLQFIGTEWGRELDENLWLNLFKARVDQLRQRDADVIIVCDDARYDNEAELIHSLGGFIVKIETNRPSVALDGIPNHASEDGLDPKYIDFTISNNGTLEEYHEKLVDLFKTIKQEAVLKS